MKIIKLIPHGFCFGVINAYQKTLKIIKENPNKKIYMLGWLVHNKNVIDELSQYGVIVLDDKYDSRYNLIKGIEDDAILILSAHGTPKDAIDLAIEKKLTIHDLTCKFVYKTHDIIKEKLLSGYEIIFIGKRNHPETLAILNIDKRINLIETANDLEHLKINGNKIFCTNQTTIGKLFFKDIISSLVSKFPNIEIVNDICDATDLRQEAVINMDDDVDVCIIIGDRRSSNCNELYKLAKQKVDDSYIVECIEDLKNIDFLSKKKCAITAAASTPKNLIDSIFEKIEKNNLHFLNKKM